MTTRPRNMQQLIAEWVCQTHAKNSREFETEADTFAREWLKEHGIAESNFDSILCRITGADGKADEIDFFSSHPATGQRARCTAEPEPKD